jgi:hypothetical protein
MCRAVTIQRPWDKRVFQRRSQQRLGTHIPAEKDTHATTDLLFEAVSSKRSVSRSYKEDNWSWKGADVQRRLEPGSRRLTIVRSPYQATTCEHTARWKRLVTCGNLRWRST